VRARARGSRPPLNATGGGGGAKSWYFGFEPRLGKKIEAARTPSQEKIHIIPGTTPLSSKVGSRRSAGNYGEFMSPYTAHAQIGKTEKIYGELKQPNPGEREKIEE